MAPMNVVPLVQPPLYIPYAVQAKSTLLVFCRYDPFSLRSISWLNPKVDSPPDPLPRSFGIILAILPKQRQAFCRLLQMRNSSNRRRHTISTCRLSGVEMTYDSTLVHGKFCRMRKLWRPCEEDDILQQKPKTKRSFSAFQERFLKILLKVAGEDWVLITLVALSMSVVSFGVDFMTELIRDIIIQAYKATENIYARYLIWTGLPTTFILFSSVIVQMFAPQAAGSGLPEVRAILSGVVLKEYLTFRTAAVKTIALIAALGSGVPIGKMGPFVHTSCAVANIIGNYLSGDYSELSERRFHYNDMLVIACAIGVAATFNAPIGGVLFAIELTSSYFAVRNYWRGFYASLLGAIVFRGMSLLRDHSSTLLPVHFLKFHTEHPFAPAEILAYIVLGLYSGIFGAMFVVMHKKIVLLERSLRWKASPAARKLVFAVIVSLVIFTTTFPYSVGKFMGKEHSIDVKLTHLLSFGIWNGDMAQRWTEIQEIWSHNRIFSYLAIFFSVNFLLSVLASTLPIPLGLYAPLFLLGGTFGRLFGELMVIMFPQGMKYAKTNTTKPIIPAGYALAGAAALSGSATHTLSIAVIAIEMTGEILYLLPIMICVTAANMVSRQLHISVYDTIVRLKRLPHLPGIDNWGYKIDGSLMTAEEFMDTEFGIIHGKMTYGELKDILDADNTKYFAYVEDPDTNVLTTLLSREHLLGILAYENEKLNAYLQRRSRAQDSQTPSVDSRFTITEVSEQEVAGKRTIERHLFSISTVPITFNTSANLLDTHLAFLLLHLEAAAVTENGRVVGIVTNKEISEGMKRSVQWH